MATHAVTTTSEDVNLRESVRRALQELLPAVHEIEAAYVVIDGPYATVRAIVEHADLPLTERLVELSYALDARTPELSFGVQPLEHRGRGVASLGWAGSSPDSERA